MEVFKKSEDVASGGEEGGPILISRKPPRVEKNTKGHCEKNVLENKIWTKMHTNFKFQVKSTKNRPNRINMYNLRRHRMFLMTFFY